MKALKFLSVVMLLGILASCNRYPDCNSADVKKTVVELATNSLVEKERVTNPSLVTWR